MHLGSAHLKTVRKTLMKLSPGVFDTKMHCLNSILRTFYPSTPWLFLLPKFEEVSVKKKFQPTNSERIIQAFQRYLLVN